MLRVPRITGSQTIVLPNPHRDNPPPDFRPGFPDMGPGNRLGEDNRAHPVSSLPEEEEVEIKRHFEKLKIQGREARIRQLLERVERYELPESVREDFLNRRVEFLSPENVENRAEFFGLLIMSTAQGILGLHPTEEKKEEAQAWVLSAEDVLKRDMLAPEDDVDAFLRDCSVALFEERLQKIVKSIQAEDASLQDNRDEICLRLADQLESAAQELESLRQSTKKVEGEVDALRVVDEEVYQSLKRSFDECNALAESLMKRRLT